QRAVFDSVVAGPRGTLIGPLRAALHRPELAEAWQRFGENLRLRTRIQARLREQALHETERRWASQLEWYIHAQAAEKAGLPPEVIEALRQGRAPRLDDAYDEAIYEFARQMQQTGAVAADAYGRVLDRWGAVGVVELTA